MDLVLSWLGLVRSKAHLADPGPSIKELLNTTSDMDLIEEIMNGWSGKAMELVLYGDEWQDVGDKLLPHIPVENDVKELYLNSITIVVLKSYPMHRKLLGGMAAGVMGLRGRVSRYRNVSTHHKLSSFHYMMMDLPGSVSESHQFAQYDNTKPLSFFLLSEGGIIALLGFGRAGARVVLKYGHAGGSGSGSGSGKAGLRLAGWNEETAAVARSQAVREKTILLITTGAPISIKPTTRSNRIGFSLLSQHVNHTAAIAFIKGSDALMSSKTSKSPQQKRKAEIILLCGMVILKNIDRV
ncbi:uncharacterized protein Bfra_008020 [Botrytis fragariae]|uniref:Uncharacterized protein n=1 Tax=Botrytis fragariae TaxID=1964551 RepID=A0A8H6EGK7_9HELO|nr:uncharacterized protein Bfra_008020 [Botrytis fragariae]KAF5871502.1 hypothetical protein Bfra_008020 [Botrytis fragariae]